jgi:hypothetical protein
MNEISQLFGPKNSRPPSTFFKILTLWLNQTGTSTKSLISTHSSYSRQGKITRIGFAVALRDVGLSYRRVDPTTDSNRSTAIYEKISSSYMVPRARG